MVKIEVTYARGKPFERKDVVKVAYTNEDNIEVVVEGPELLTHRFPLATELFVYATDGMSRVSCQGLRAISAFDIQDK